MPSSQGSQTVFAHGNIFLQGTPITWNKFWEITGQGNSLHCPGGPGKHFLSICKSSEILPKSCSIGSGCQLLFHAGQIFRKLLRSWNETTIKNRREVVNFLSLPFLSVHRDSSNKTPQTGWLNPEHLFLIILEAGKSKVRTLTD